MWRCHVQPAELHTGWCKRYLLGQRKLDGVGGGRLKIFSSGGGDVQILPDSARSDAWMCVWRHAVAYALHEDEPPRAPVEHERAGLRSERVPPIFLPVEAPVRMAIYRVLTCVAARVAGILIATGAAKRLQSIDTHTHTHAHMSANVKFGGFGGHFNPPASKRSSRNAGARVPGSFSPSTRYCLSSSSSSSRRRLCPCSPHRRARSACSPPRSAELPCAHWLAP